MASADAAAPGASDASETTELDPAGVLTRSVEPGTGFIPVQPASARTAPPGAPAPVPTRRARRERPTQSPYAWWPGAAALLLGVVLVVLDAVAVGQAGAGSYAGATALAWGAIVASVLAVLGGGVAIVLGRGRLLGGAAVVLGIAANPYLLTRVFEVLGG